MYFCYQPAFTRRLLQRPLRGRDAHRDAPSCWRCRRSPCPQLPRRASPALPCRRLWLRGARHPPRLPLPCALPLPPQTTTELNLYMRCRWHVCRKGVVAQRSYLQRKVWLGTLRCVVHRRHRRLRLAIRRRRSTAGHPHLKRTHRCKAQPSEKALGCPQWVVRTSPPPLRAAPPSGTGAPTDAA